eukprot:TRINITY_DN52275_c0_g1_i1.p1 TRINITY_DN52275_c0_g1~~TRINITY_DN52275_c0_g1_i1.p1  ORF type:complete len:225 (-),score=33.44 TRINITY_DN52275_c0_g1_i1:79-753(-)
MALSCEGRVSGIYLAPSRKDEPSFPKKYVASARLNTLGFEADRQNEPVDADWGGHGGPLKAVCLWSADVVRDLQAEGHPLQVGGCGENLLVEGVPWGKVVPGTRLEIGDVLLEVTQYSRPCHKQPHNFSKGNYMVIHHLRAPDRSRVYCAVLAGAGSIIKEGAPVKLHVETKGAKPYLNNADVVGKLAKSGKQHASFTLEWTHVAFLLTGLLAGHLATRLSSRH